MPARDLDAAGGHGVRPELGDVLPNRIDIDTWGSRDEGGHVAKLAIPSTPVDL